MPLFDGMRQRFPIVNVLLIPANLAVWLFHELSHLDSVADSSFYVCSAARGRLRPAT